MKYIKNGKLVLDGTIRECDLQDKLNKALEIIVDKEIDIFILKRCNDYETYNDSNHKEISITQKEFKVVKEIIG